MKIKVKMFKKLISLLCAAMISTSCVAPSVGAFKKAAKVEKGVSDSVNNANYFLDLIKSRINSMFQQLDGGSERYIGDMSEDSQIKLAEVLSYLEMSKQCVNEFDAVVIDDLNLAESITSKLSQVVFDDRYSEGDVSNFQEYSDLLEKYSGFVSDMSNVLGDIKGMIQKHEQQKAEKEKEENIINEFNRIVPEFNRINMDFRSWRDNDKNKGKVVESEQVRRARLEAIQLYYGELQNNINAEKAKQFIGLAKKAIDSMNKFKAEYEQKQAEKERLEREKQAQINKNQNNNEFSLFNNDNIANNKNMTLEQFESLLAGDQHENNKRIVNGQCVEVGNTCGVHVITTLKNIYDYIGGKKSGFVQGFNNVIDNFLANGGQDNRIFQPTGPGKVGEPLNADDFKGFLQKNKLGMKCINFFEQVDTTKEAAGTQKTEYDVVREHKIKWKERIKEFLKSYMKGKNFAPIATVGGGHWQLLAQYDEKNDRVLRLDSAPKKAEWVSLDTVSENFVQYENWGEGMYAFMFEMPIFTTTEGFKDYNVDSVDEFTEQKQKELIESIG